MINTIQANEDLHTHKIRKSYKRKIFHSCRKLNLKSLKKNAGELDDRQVQESSSRYNLSILLDASISPSTALKVDDDDGDDDKLLLQNG